MFEYKNSKSRQNKNWTQDPGTGGAWDPGPGDLGTRGPVDLGPVTKDPGPGARLHITWRAREMGVVEFPVIL